MKIYLNHSTDTVVISPGVQVPFDTMRQYLLYNYPELCQHNFVKAIKTTQGILFTYDWEYIFYVASTTTIAYDFVASLKLKL